jgi:CHASE2 domain-containing sensor protein
MLAIVALLAVGVGIAVRQTGATASLEYKSIDARFSVRGRTPVPPDVAIVAIDGKTFSYFTEHHLHAQFPFPRRYYARVLDNLHRAGARLIAVDIQFTEPTNQTDDLALYNAVSRDRPVVLATSEVQGKPTRTSASARSSATPPCCSATCAGSRRSRRASGRSVCSTSSTSTSSR